MFHKMFHFVLKMFHLVLKMFDCLLKMFHCLLKMSHFFLTKTRFIPKKSKKISKYPRLFSKYYPNIPWANPEILKKQKFSKNPGLTRRCSKNTFFEKNIGFQNGKKVAVCMFVV